MKRLSLLAVVVLVAASFSACNGGSKSVTAQEVASQVSVAHCKRLVECIPGATMKEETCAKAAGDALNKLIAEKTIQISKADLDGCLKSIKSSPCAEITNPEGPPKGCEKLQ